MTVLSARRLIVAYAALLALFDLIVLLPGNPYSSRGEFVAAVAVQTLVVWRLWHRSSLAWLLAMAFAAGQVVTTLLVQPPLEVGVILTFVLSIAQARARQPSKSDRHRESDRKKLLHRALHCWLLVVGAFIVRMPNTLVNCQEGQVLPNRQLDYRRV
jgi:hypothetical protein